MWNVIYLGKRTCLYSSFIKLLDKGWTLIFPGVAENSAGQTWQTLICGEGDLGMSGLGHNLQGLRLSCLQEFFPASWGSWGQWIVQLQWLGKQKLMGSSCLVKEFRYPGVLFTSKDKRKDRHWQADLCITNSTSLLWQRESLAWRVSSWFTSQSMFGPLFKVMSMWSKLQVAKISLCHRMSGSPLGTR